MIPEIAYTVYADKQLACTFDFSKLIKIITRHVLIHLTILGIVNVGILALKKTSCLDKLLLRRYVTKVLYRKAKNRVFLLTN